MYCVILERKFDIFLFGVASKAFKQYSEADTVEKIDEMIHDEKARIECQYQSNPQVSTYTKTYTGNILIDRFPNGLFGGNGNK